jgi:hypothetical protein
MRRSLAALALAGLLLTACGDDAGRATAATSPSSGAAGSSVPEALQFSAPVVGGGPLDMSEYAGQTVAFWFWAPT